MKTPNISGSQFLHDKQRDLHSSREVETIVDYLKAGGERIPNEPAEKLTAYLGFLANRDYVNDGILTGDQISINRQIEAHVIEPSKVPEAYFDLQRRIAREQGHGDIASTPDMRGQLIEAIQADQRASLGKWVEYLGGDDGGYPDWFKYYAWESVTRLGNFDKEKGEFLKRSTGTTAAYPELNREALAYVFDKINKSRVAGDKDSQAEVMQGEDEALRKLLKSANFGKLYAHAILEVAPDSPELRKQIIGSWKKYDQTSDPRTARRLSESLQGHGTGWCTAGESTAATQLHDGDFYVYYSRDDDGNDIVPRLAIRMENGVVSYDVRGILPNQEVEPELLDTLTDKLQTLPGGEEYSKKAEDMKRLTELTKRCDKDPGAVLSKDDMKFLYELDHQIQSFGYQIDPRIEELKAKRGERDHETLKVLAVEYLRDSFEASYQGYNTVCAQLNAMRAGSEQIAVLSEEQIKQLFEAKMREWQTSGVLDYVAERFISHDEIHTPIMRPNIVVTTDELKALANNFAHGQGFDAAYVYDDLYDSYDESDYVTLSGYKADAGEVAIALLPNKYTDELGYNTVVEQQKILERMQLAAPKLNLRSPSAFDGLALWNTLRAQGDDLNNSDVWSRTSIRQLNIESRKVLAYSCVPNVSVDDGGRPFLYYSYSDYAYDARVSLG